MYVIGITGLSCSGKTELSLNLSKHFKDECLLLSMDDYYKDLTPEQSQQIYDDSACINFDEPAAIDFDKFVSHLTDIIDNKPVTIPKYDLGSCVVTEHVLIEANKYKFIVVEGVFIFSDVRLREMCHLKVWVETSEYVCALRRFIKYTRDIQGYSPEFVYAQCIKHVIPGQENYVKPMKRVCDVIYNGETACETYVEMVAYLIKTNAQKKKGLQE